MQGFSIYDQTTGEILGRLQNEDVAQMNVDREDGQAVLVGGYDDRLYFVTDLSTAPRAILRPKFTPIEDRTITADGQHETTFSALPPGTTLRIRQRLGGKLQQIMDEIAIDDGSFVFSTALAGTYYLIFSAAFPYREQTVTVTANAP